MGSPIMGAYTDPTQLGQDVADNNQQAAQTFGNYAPSAKDALAQQRIQASLLSPYYKSLLGVNNHGPTYDLSPSNSWSEGIAKGAGNLMSGIRYGHEQRDDKAVQAQWQQSIADQQAQQQQAAQAAAQQQAQQEALATEHIRQTQGDEAAFAYQQNPKKFTEAMGTGYGALPTVQAHAQNTAFGTGLGQGQAHLQNIQANQQFLQNNGVTPGAENTGQLTPQAINLTHQVTGDTPVDLLDFKNRQVQLGQAQNTYQHGAVDNQTLGARNNADLTGKNLNNQGQVTENQLKQVELQYKAANENAGLQEKYLTQQEKAQAMAKREAADRLFQTTMEQMRQGKTLTPSDSARLDQAMKMAGYDTNFLSNLKTITGVKSGQSLTNEKVQKATGSTGFVTLPSGLQYNPATHAVIQPGQQQAKPKPKHISAAPGLDTGSGISLTQLLPNYEA
jgi:hypothetical protein